MRTYLSKGALVGRQHDCNICHCFHCSLFYFHPSCGCPLDPTCPLCSLQMGGSASSSLDGWMEPYRNGLYYPCQLVFSKPLDVQALEAALVKMTEEAGLRKDQWTVRWEKDTPRPFPTQSSISGDHYVLEKVRRIFSPFFSLPHSFVTQRGRETHFSRTEIQRRR